jgi:hypothetical protein
MVSYYYFSCRPLTSFVRDAEEAEFIFSFSFLLTLVKQASHLTGQGGQKGKKLILS